MENQELSPPVPDIEKVPDVPTEELAKTAPKVELEHVKELETKLKTTEQQLKEFEIEKHALADKLSEKESEISKMKQDIDKIKKHHKNLKHKLCYNHLLVTLRGNDYRGYKEPIIPQNVQKTQYGRGLVVGGRQIGYTGIQNQNPSAQLNFYNPEKVRESWGGRGLGFQSSSYGAYFG